MIIDSTILPKSFWTNKMMERDGENSNKAPAGRELLGGFGAISQDAVCILNQKLVYGVVSAVGGTPGPGI